MPDEVKLHAPPVLSTPESHIFEDPAPLATGDEPRLTDEEIWSVYEVERTAKEISEGGWRRVALQFPDHMLGDAVRVFEGLEKELKRLSSKDDSVGEKGPDENLEKSFTHLMTGVAAGKDAAKEGQNQDDKSERNKRQRLSILADTSYGACCVDEIAAEHVDAEVVVHYGRSCLSPTARLPVIYVFTCQPLDIDDVITAFEATYAQREGMKDERIVLMADIVYNSHVQTAKQALEQKGWKNIITPEIVHDPSSLIPNRDVEMNEEDLKGYSVFHISDPPSALLLTLSSRVQDLHIYPTLSSSTPRRTVESNTRMALRRRYGLLTSLSTCGVFGILINTLSVRNYLSTVTAIKDQIAASGKKSYTFVVGKVNAAKIANFSEIGGWVVIGCWESSLIESSEFYRPIITPFELGVCLMSDEERIWSGSWRGDFESLEIRKTIPPASLKASNTHVEHGNGDIGQHDVEGGDLDSEEESEPPEFDLRTGRYVSHSRPMRKTMVPPVNGSSSPLAPTAQEASSNLARRAKLELANINGVVSPGAEYLRSQRTWTGLGSDFNDLEAPQMVEEGRSGVARGYTVGESAERL